jgi:hypothetical protein
VRRACAASATADAIATDLRAPSSTAPPTPTRADIERRHEGLDFRAHVADALRRLADLARDGLVELEAGAVRIAAMAFDEYLSRPREQHVAKFSRVI